MNQNLKLTFFFVLLIANIAVLSAQTESDFYTEPTEFKITKNLVTDFKVDNDFSTDDSKQLQKAINSISKKGGGKLIVPEGNYTFSDILMRSDVHIEFDPAVVIRPAFQEKQKNYSIFNFGKKGGVVKNVSMTSSNPDEQYTVDLTKANNIKVAVFVLRNIDNFLLSNVYIKDIQSKFSSFTLGLTTFEGEHYVPRNGVIKNSTTTDADYGYGLIQTQAAKNVFFKDLGGQGGVTLRLETGEKKMNNLQKGGIHDVFAKNIECHDGNAALMISPHCMHNGIVTIDGVTAVNCGFGVRIGGSYIAKKYDQNIGLTPGTFDPKSSIKNVTATFGEKAQVKPKHFQYIPKTYQSVEKTANSPITNTFSNPKSTKKRNAVFAVSIAAVGYFSGKNVECTSKNGKVKKSKAGYTINIDKSTINAIGFTEQKPIIDLTDDVLSDCVCTD